MSVEDIQNFVGQGWIYVPDGSAWGLADAPFLAFNSSFSCGGGSGGGESSSSGGGGGGGGGNPGAPVCNDVAPAGAPTLISVIANGNNSVTLTWTPAIGPVSYYLVAYGTQPGVYLYGNPNVGGSGTTSYTVNNLSGGTTYYFVVRAGNGCMPGPFSNELSNAPTGRGGGQVLGIASANETPRGEVLGISFLAGTSSENTTLLLLVSWLFGLLFIGYGIYIRKKGN